MHNFEEFRYTTKSRLSHDYTIKSRLSHGSETWVYGAPRLSHDFSTTNTRGLVVTMSCSRDLVAPLPRANRGNTNTTLCNLKYIYDFVCKYMNFEKSSFKILNCVVACLKNCSLLIRVAVGLRFLFFYGYI